MGAQRGINAGGRIERLPFTRFKYLLYGTLMFIFTAEALDNGLTGTTLSTVDKAFNANPGLYAVASTVGVVIGLVFAGALQDVIGRKRPLFIANGIAALFAFAATFSPNYSTLVTLRVCQGFGLGMIFVIVPATISEWALGASRGRGFAWMDIGLQIGQMVVPFLSLFIMVPFPVNIGWKNMYYFAGAVSLVAFAASFALPESVRWLESRGRAERAENIMKKIEERVSRELHSPLPQVTKTYEVTGKRARPFTELFNWKVFRQTLLVMCSSVAIYSIFYLLQVFQPTWLVYAGLKLNVALEFTTITLFFTLFGKYLGGYLGDRIGRRATLLTFIFIGAVFLEVTGLFRTIAVGVMIGTIVTNFFIQGSAPIQKAFSAEPFSSGSRGSGYAVIDGSARAIGGILVPYLFASVLGTAAFGTYALVLAIIAVALALTTYAFAKETGKVTVEEAAVTTSAIQVNA
ncbi:MAG: MFS transporter [Nitrososphaerota archaeon]|nr:MFS transporter [Nitrososphaerota archaeon]MDG7026155.1 MFS transporter [Nitrososphaerota archaeon]